VDLILAILLIFLYVRNREKNLLREHKILEEKVTGLLKEMVKLENKSVTIEEFNKLFE